MKPSGSVESVVPSSCASYWLLKLQLSVWFYLPTTIQESRARFLLTVRAPQKRQDSLR